MVLHPALLIYHLHCHLQESLLDFGPASSFWSFPFEGLNGVLRSVQTNHQCIEIQLMRNFCSNQHVLQTFENSSDDVLKQLFSPVLSSVGTLEYEELPELPLFCHSQCQM